MNSSNPFEPTHTELAPQPTLEVKTLSQRPAFNAAVLTELGVKLVGLMFVLDGIGGLISEVVIIFLERQEMAELGVTPYMVPVTMGGFASSFFFLFVGVYLVTNGKLVIDLILMTDSEPDEKDAQA